MCAGIIVGPAAFVVLVVGHTGVTVGLWPVHVVMTYYTVAKYALYRSSLWISCFRTTFDCWNAVTFLHCSVRVFILLGICVPRIW
jgi:hypothetical protein